MLWNLEPSDMSCEQEEGIQLPLSLFSDSTLCPRPRKSKCGNIQTKKEFPKLLRSRKLSLLMKKRRLPTLPRVCSTIGAGGLNCSVRNGKRWDPATIATLMTIMTNHNNKHEHKRFTICQENMRHIPRRIKTPREETYSGN